MDIVDAQLHLGRGMIEATLEAMDSLGIAAVLIDEFWGGRLGAEPTHIAPGYRLPNGAWRTAFPTAEEASLLHPDRFAYLVRIDRRDPELESVMRTIASTPNARAFRLQPVWTVEEAAAFAAGAYEPLLDLAQDLGLPLCWFIPGYVELLAPYAARYPQLTLVIDHCGMGFPNIPPGREAEAAARSQSVGYFDEVLKLAEHPNVALKWSHAQTRFGASQYPYEPLRPLLRRAIEAFGPERLMWASDKTVMFGHRWADLLCCLRDDPELSSEEKAWILGRTARRVLNWAPSGPA